MPKQTMEFYFLVLNYFDVNGQPASEADLIQAESADIARRFAQSRIDTAIAADLMVTDRSKPVLVSIIPADSQQILSVVRGERRVTAKMLTSENANDIDLWPEVLNGDDG